MLNVECAMRSKSIRLIISLVLVLLVSSCGYHISGTGGIVPEGVHTISVPVFFNATNEP
jgi:outer membrane lipopolysaccharide assembly protein LptE/RlpB